MKRLFVVVLFMQLFGGVAMAQWVTSGSGIGERTGDQGLTSPTSLAQSLGYDDDEDMAAAASQGYGDNENDALAWDYASSEQFDEDCVALFGVNCDQVDADEFLPLVPQIIECIGLGFNSLTEMGDYVDGVEALGGDEEDASNCKARGYSASGADSQLCMTATNDDENEAACRAKLGAAAGSDANCSDLDRDDYEDIANNMPPRIIAPADWAPSEVAADAAQGTVLVSVLSATDPDGDALTWSLSNASPSVFAIDPNNGTLSLATSFGGTSTRPETAQVTVQVSDGYLTDDLTLSLAFADENGPPRIIVPADWNPSQVSRDAQQGDTLISILSAVDPDGDALTWSITESDLDIFAINPQSGDLSLAAANGLADFADRPASVSVTVAVSDGQLSDDLSLVIGLQNPNGPPRIVVPADWAPSIVSAEASTGDAVISVLGAIDPDSDPLTWSITNMDYDVFAIDPQSGRVTIVENDNAPADQPEKVSLTVSVSDGELSDEMTLVLTLEDPNGPPVIIVPEGFQTVEIGEGITAGTTVVSGLVGQDPDGDKLTWSIAETSSNNTFQINADSGEVSVKCSTGPIRKEPACFWTESTAPYCWVPAPSSAYNGGGKSECFTLDSCNGGQGRSGGDCYKWAYSESSERIDWNGGADTQTTKPSDQHSISIQLSDGELTDTENLVVSIEPEKINTPPVITVPQNFADGEFAPYPNSATAVGTLQGTDAEGDKLTWSLLSADPSVFTINADTGAISYNQLGENDKLSCTSANSRTTSAQPQMRGGGGTANYGITAINSNVVQDHNGSDFRSKKDDGRHTKTGKFHVTLERANHRGGSFTTDARSATQYAYGTSGSTIYVPALAAATVNSNITPINSYLVFQHNGPTDMSDAEGVVTFTNPIVGIYYSDDGFDGTITRLGKPGALYTRKVKQNKLGLEDDKDIAWIDPIDRRKLRFRSRTANIGDFLRVITTASNDSGGEDDDTVTGSGPDECAASLVVQLSDGEATDEETLTLAFSDPNRAPEIIAPMDWVPELITNDKNANDRVVSVLASRDPDGDTLRWSLSGDNADLFSIDVHSGDISLAGNWSELGDRPARATVTVELTDGRLSATQEIDFNIEEKPMETSMASNIGTNGNFQFVSEDVQNIFNQDYTIMARFFHGSTGYSKPYFDYKKFKWINQSPKETIFFWGGNAQHRKFLSGISLHVVGDTIRLQLGSDGSYLETRAPIQRNRWHTVMFAVDADQRRKTKKHNWPVKMYLNGRRVGLNEFSFETKNKGYKPIGTPEGGWNKQMDSTAYTGEVYVEANNLPVAAIGIAGTIKPGGHWGNKQRRHLPLRGSSFIHEVSIWQGDKSSVASAIYNNNRDVADYASTSVGKPRYSWKPGLLGQSKSEIHCGNMGNYWNYTTGRYTCLGTPDGEAVLEENKDWTCGWRCNPDPRNFVIDRWKGTLTLANLANSANPKNGKSNYVGPTAGNGTYRLDGDMHLYSGGLTFETEVYQKTYRKRMTGIIIPVPQATAIDVCRGGAVAAGMPVQVWHQGGYSTRTYLSGLKKWHGWSSNCEEYNDDDIKAFATRAMSGKTKPLN